MTAPDANQCRSSRALAVVAWVALSGCSPSADARDPAMSAITTATATASSVAVISVLGEPLSGPPRLVIENHSTADIELYAGSIVDQEGKLGTMALWPHANDCPGHEHQKRLLPLGGTYDLATPAHAFDDEKCAPGAALPPGNYVVHIDSGYASELYASAEISLPLSEPVRLRMEAHEKPPSCTPLRARRAARLVLAASKIAGAPDAALRDCDPIKAVCGSLPLPEEVPPRACSLTLHENLLRIRLPPRTQAPKEITGWLDHDLVATDRPNLSGSSSAELFFGADRVVFEGITGRHMHEHGGKAAGVGSMTVRVVNASKRTLKLKVLGVQWLFDGDCGAPKEEGAELPAASFEPRELPPGESSLQIGFASRSAYQVHCDMFGSRARLQVEGRQVVVTSEHEVTRVEPMRRNEAF